MADTRTDQELIEAMQKIIQDRRAGYNTDVLEAITERFAGYGRLMADLKIWKRDCLDFAETQKCARCGWNVGFTLPFGAILRIKEAEDVVVALKERCKELEKWASEHGLMILDKKEFWKGMRP
jgi:hypothetical protein